MMKIIDIANFVSGVKLRAKKAKRNGNEKRVNKLAKNSR
jgi:hypothetical protein